MNISRNKAKIFFLIGSVLLVCGCSVINFSGNYYDPPKGYKQEIIVFYDKLISRLNLQNKYQITIVEGKDSNRLNGIPAISGNVVILPDDFVKYVYQNYYDDRFIILSTTIVHELCHSEFGLPSRPPEVHFQTDLKAIQIMGETKETAENFYKSFVVVKNYWFARKGMGGHALNTAWNLVNVASAVKGGPGYFRDWFATDLRKRMQLMSKRYGLKGVKGFARSAD